MRLRPPGRRRRSRIHHRPSDGSHRRRHRRDRGRRGHPGQDGVLTKVTENTDDNIMVLAAELLNGYLRKPMHRWAKADLRHRRDIQAALCDNRGLL